MVNELPLYGILACCCEKVNSNSRCHNTIDYIVRT